MSLVPPQASAFGLEAGKSTWTWPSVPPSPLPLSPAATHTLMPSAAASAIAASIAARPCAVQASSDWPQLIEMTIGRRARVRRVGDRVDEALVAVVGRKVHHLRRAGRGGADDVDVQRHLDVGPGGIRAGGIRRPVHAHRGDRGHREAQAAEVGVQVAGREAAAKLDDRDRLARRRWYRRGTGRCQPPGSAGTSCPGPPRRPGAGSAPGPAAGYRGRGRRPRCRPARRGRKAGPRGSGA